MKKTVVKDELMSKLDFFKTQQGISLVKKTFEEVLSSKLRLLEVAAPRIVSTDRGLQDDLAGTQEAVCFRPKALDCDVEIVHSLAKWKRFTLGKYDFKPYSGIITVMDAIRKDEDLSPIHSMYVDQWDWELVIKKDDRSISFLKQVVRDIYESIKETQSVLCKTFPSLRPRLQEDISFVTTQELEDMFPTLSAKDREHAIAKKLGSVFIIGIGDKLKGGAVHDLRAADYDDWSLDGDIILWDDIRQESLEISSMGIRVDKTSLLEQLEKTGQDHYKDFEFHKGILDETLPLSIGGGIGRSRLSMFLLGKAHIGEVQSSLWSDEIIKSCKDSKVELL